MCCSSHRRDIVHNMAAIRCEDITVCRTLFCLVFFVVFSSALHCEDPVCEFELDIRWGRTMVYRTESGEAAYNVQLNESKLQIVENTFHLKSDPNVGKFVDYNDVITADGYVRNVITVNGQFPGPTLEVSEGAEMVIHVTNNLEKQATSIHWHGIHQLYTPWMDGVPYVTQCPIAPRQTFTYRFMAHPCGTHWYHSHLRNQRIDGLYGMLIVHKRVSMLPYFPVLISDWSHRESTSHSVTNPFTLDLSYTGTGELYAAPSKRDSSVDGIENSAHVYVSGLINGKGSYGYNMMPLATFKVKQSGHYLFRVVNTAADFAYELSIDQHELEVVASDGYDIEPFKVDSIIIHAGETYDFIVEMNQNRALYWMRSRTLRAGIGPDAKTDGIEPHGMNAIVEYEGAPKHLKHHYPQSKPRKCSFRYICLVLNCPYRGYPTSHFKRCISIAETRGRWTPRDILKSYGDSDPVYEGFLNFGFQNGPSINAIRFVPPKVPLFQSYTSRDVIPCDKRVCKEEGCTCTNIMNLPFNRTIQLVISNLAPEGRHATIMSHHPVHLHGHGFAVLHMGFPEFDRRTGLQTEQTKDVECINKKCTSAKWGMHKPRLNLRDPPVKDTVVIPAGGYTVIRFRSDNPGFWLLHCHMDSHSNAGMTMMLHEAPSQIPSVPAHFPRCNHYMTTHSQFVSYVMSHPLNKGKRSFEEVAKYRKPDEVFGKHGGGLIDSPEGTISADHPGRDQQSGNQEDGNQAGATVGDTRGQAGREQGGTNQAGSDASVENQRGVAGTNDQNLDSNPNVDTEHTVTIPLPDGVLEEAEKETTNTNANSESGNSHSEGDKGLDASRSAGKERPKNASGSSEGDHQINHVEGDKLEVDGAISPGGDHGSSSSEAPSLCVTTDPEGLETRSVTVKFSAAVTIVLVAVAFGALLAVLPMLCYACLVLRRVKRGTLAAMFHDREQRDVPRVEGEPSHWIGRAMRNTSNPLHVFRGHRLPRHSEAESDSLEMDPHHLHL